MPSIDEMIGVILEHESDRYTNDPTDAGGPTKDGVSLRYLKGKGILTGDLDHDGDVDENDVKLVTPDIAAEFFKYDFYRAPHYDTLPAAFQPVMFDMAVNMGAKDATKCLQHVLLAEEDGYIGDQTRIALNDAIARIGEKVVINHLVDRFIQHYEAIVAAKPSQAKFLNGWKNRANSWRQK